MPVLPNGQTCLENIGLQMRPVLLAKNQYQSTFYSKDELTEYSARHPNALWDPLDGRGFGTGHGGHTHYAPDCNKAVMIGEHMQSPIDYSNFDTYNGGDCIAVNGRPGLSFSGRNGNTSINNYSYNGIHYGAEYVNTTQNVEDGQYVVGLNNKTDIICNPA
jgi:hypothetical protein